MPENDCGICDKLINCGGSIITTEEFQTLVVKLLCEGVDNLGGGGGGGDASAANQVIANALLDLIRIANQTVAGAVAGTEMQVDVVAALPTGANAIGKLAANAGVNIGSVAIASALPAGSNAIGKLAANSGVDIGDVDVTSMPFVRGEVADDAVASGNPIPLAGVAKETDGTDPGSVSAEDDAAGLITDRNRRLIVNPAHPNGWRANETAAAAQTDNALRAAPGANLSLYITDMIFSNDGTAAASLKIVEDTAASSDVLGPYYLPASASGMTKTFSQPVRLTANKDAGYTSTGATNITVTLIGFTAP